MSIIPCEQNPDLRKLILEFSETLKTESHKLGAHGLSERDFYDSGLFRGAIERVRGQFSATMGPKRELVKCILNHMQDGGFIADWKSAGGTNRFDYSVALNSGKTAVIELKGCLDGNNVLIFERPPHAQEFIVWSVCTNIGADPRLNAWSGLHTRLSADIVDKEISVDGVIFWDMVCGTLGRRCPKIGDDENRLIEIGPYKLPPPCIYVLPATVPSPRNNPHPPAQHLEDVELLGAFNTCFGGREDEVNYVDFQVKHKGSEILRTTTTWRGGEKQKVSRADAIRRS